MNYQVYYMLGVLGAFVALGVLLTFSIKKHDAKMAQMKKKKKGRSKYMPEYRKPGK